MSRGKAKVERPFECAECHVTFTGPHDECTVCGSPNVVVRGTTAPNPSAEPAAVGAKTDSPTESAALAEAEAIVAAASGSVAAPRAVERDDDGFEVVAPKPAKTVAEKKSREKKTAGPCAICQTPMPPPPWWGICPDCHKARMIRLWGVGSYRELTTPQRKDYLARSKKARIHPDYDWSKD